MIPVFAKAKKQDIIELEQFLLTANVHNEEVKSQYEYYMIAKNEEGTIIATIALVPVNHFGLLRSLVISPSFPANQVSILVEQMVETAIARQFASLFLATDKPSAIAFFENLGFEEVEKEKLPEQLKSFPHVEKQIFVKNGRFMQRIL
jgi:N-acetylglutamate synthase-like GNAT family acetyltransferase